MLRIKDNVSLEVLKDYGFLEFGGAWEYISGNKFAAVFLVVPKENRRVMLATTCDEGDFDSPNVSEKITDAAVEVLYELIESGIVEKMEDENE